MNRLLQALKTILSPFTPFFSWLRVQLDSSGSPEKRRRNRIIFFTFIAAFVLGSSAHLLFYGPRWEQIPIANNLVILFLLNINIILLLLLGILIGRNLVKLYFERPVKAATKRFQTKLIVSFVTFTLIPSILLFIVASGLITNAIDQWLNETVERSLKDSLEVAETFYKSSEEAVSEKASKLAQLINDRGMFEGEDNILLVNTLRKTLNEYEVERIIVYDKDLQIFAQVSIKGANSPLPGPVGDAGRIQLQLGQTVTRFETAMGIARVFSLAPITMTGESGSVLLGAVFIADSLDRVIVGKIDAITRTFDEYKQLKLQKFPIKAVYEITLLLVTLIVLFAALWYGFYLAREITVPISQLAEATEKVTAGDLTVRLDAKSDDEIGFLVNSFNRMTEELDISRSKIESSHKELVEINLEVDQRRKYIETILAKIATGVISINNRGRITTFNPAARSILKTKAEDPLGRYYEDVFDPVHLEPMRALMREMGRNEKESLEKQIQVDINGVQLTLIIHIATLRDAGGKFLGLAVVFDDLTALINAQKTLAWREIAQYMAHEIKNPLTPIKLNTERLRRHFKQDRKSFDKIFENSTRTIIKEVDVLKTLVDEFGRFAQIPEAKPTMTSLHEIINDVVGMYKDLKKEITIKTSFDTSIRKVRLDAEQMRRVFRNLIENAVDAIGSKGNIEINTLRDKEGKRILIDIIDNGPGINAKNLDKVFLPYFSTKKKGTGLGLAIVNRIVADHEGHIRVKNRSPHGTVMAIDLPDA